MAATRCPHCRTLFKLPDAKLHSSLRCPKCSETFVAEAEEAKAAPRPRVRREPPPKKGFQPMHAVLILVAVGGLAGAWYFMQENQPVPVEDDLNAAAPVTPKPAAARPAAHVPPLQHAAMRTVNYVRRAVFDYNEQTLVDLLDPGAWYAKTASPDDPLWTAVRRNDRDAFIEELISGIVKDAEWREFAEHEPTAAFIRSDAGNQMRFEVRCAEIPERIWSVELVEADGRWKLTAFESATDAAPDPAEAENRPTDSTGKPIARTEEEYIEQNFVTIDDGKTRIYKGEIAPVDPHPDETPEMATKLNQLVGEFLSDDGLVRRRAREEIVDLGPVAVPYLLNRVAALPLTEDPDRVDELSQLNDALAAITYRRSHWPVPGMTALTPDQDIHEVRKLALESWYGWWRHYRNRWDEWKKEAGIPEPDPRRRRRR